MKFTLSWLKEHLDTNASVKEITDKLTAIGLELEGLEDPAQKFAPFKAAHVISAEQHPDADRLRVCQVETEDGVVQVVCGAPNAKTGMRAIFAPAGAYVPGTDLLLKKGKIRGQESNGMLVSEREMGLSDEHDGIIELDSDVAIGTPFADIYNINDPVIEIGLTPNRADCTGVYGIARDLAAAGLGTLKPLPENSFAPSGASSVTVSIDSTDACPHFMGRTIKGVKNGPSPEWLKARLKAIGLRPISALVDITNYMTFGYGRPLHVYDIDKLSGNITVRLSQKGESFDALNDKSYTLDDGQCAITDESGVIGLGGIVGGTSTGCEDDTTNVFLEAAYFDPMTIARTGRDLGVISDARYRFERGIDPAFTAIGIDIATQMIIDICGGEASDVKSAGFAPDHSREIDFDPAYTLKLSGIDIAADEQIKILTTLGFDVNGSKVTPPSWRDDIEGKADLVEEVVRIYGLDKLTPVSLRSENAVSDSAETKLLSRARKARTALAARGLDECITWSFMPKALAEIFGANDNRNAQSLTLSNPISSELDQMRPSILPNLIEAAVKNADRGFGNTALFEVGPAFRSVKPDGYDVMAAGIRHGALADKHWSSPDASRDIDLIDIKADAIAALEAAGAPTTNLQVSRDAPDYYHPGRSGTLRLGKFVLAQFGDIHPMILEEMDVKASIAGFEIFLDNIPDAKKKGSAKPLLKLSQLHPVTRDFAFLLDENVEAENIIRAAKGADKNLITEVQIFDVYQGKGVEDGKKSVAINVTIQPQEATMTDVEIEGLSQKIIGAVASKTGGALRG